MRAKVAGTPHITRYASENQVVFRDRNEKVLKNITEFNETATETGEHPIDIKGRHYLHFICECSDEKCVERIKVTFSAYKKIHKDRNAFMIKPHHELVEIEDVISKPSMHYWVVKKHEAPSQTASKLKPSGLHPVL